MEDTRTIDSAHEDINDGCLSRNRTSVAVVIPTFNQARFLGDALTSVLAQTRPADEVIVVDDGSIDDPAAVVAKFENVQMIRQENRGQAAARNVGLRICTASHVVFLDADDRLLPTALEAGLTCIAKRPDCAFVFGGYRLISEDGLPIGPNCINSIEPDAHLQFLRQSPIAVPAMVLHRRDCLLAMNGFDETLRGPEDRDLYLRIAQKYPIANHSEIVAEYRRHGQNWTNNHYAQLKAVLRMFDLHEARISNNAAARAALREGRARKRMHYAQQLIAAASVRWRASREYEVVITNVFQAARWSPLFTMHVLLDVFGNRVSNVLPRSAAHWIDWIRGRRLSKTERDNRQNS